MENSHCWDFRQGVVDTLYLGHVIIYHDLVIVWAPLSPDIGGVPNWLSVIHLPVQVSGMSYQVLTSVIRYLRQHLNKCRSSDDISS